jgi:hypothetical protein
MLTERWSVLFLAGVIAALAGCGGPSTHVENQPASPSSAALSISFQAAPPTSTFINTPVNITAVVNHDPLNAGVDWTLAPCGNPDCGSLSAPHTQSGMPVTYKPPASLTTNGLAVQILAFATADPSKNLVTRMTINTFSTILTGTYVLQTSGLDIDPITGAQDVALFAGVVVLDGVGGVKSGEQTYTNTSRSASDQITGGSYFVGPDGRGTLTLNTADPNIGQGGIEAFNIAVLSSSQAQILKNDPVNASFPSNETATGTMELQSNVSPLSHGYAFVVTGTDVASTLSLGATSPTGVGGVLNIDSPNTISGTGSIADQDLPAVPSLTRRAPISGSVSAPDAFGAVKFNLSTPFSSTPILFTGYIVDGTHIKLIETDVDAVNATGAATSGVAVGQGAATGTFKNIAVFAGNYLFGILGQDTSGPINFTAAASTLTSAGTFTATSTGSLNNGFNEAFFDGLFVNLVDTFQTPPCVLDKKGTGRLDCQLTYTANSTGPEFIFYQTGNGNPPLLLDADSNLLGGSGVGAGVAFPISATPVSFNGNYGVRLTQATFGSEADFVGQFNANGPAQTLAGTLDVNTGFVNPGPTAITGTFKPGPHANVLSGTLSNPDQFLLPNASANGINVDYYLIDSSHGFLIETDLNDPINPSSSVAFGYFAARTPVCQGCP